ncbi:MAG: DUF4810 domain-containing protein [Treponema sp.]|nr:DUF4810 domain-containing protein [Treponema sp.]
MKKTLVNGIKLAVASGLAFLALSCGTTKLYSWYDYQEDYYHAMKDADEESVKELAETYQKIIEKQKETRGIVPPGIYADYGWMLLQSGKVEEGKAMLAKEMELYPESATFVGSILKRYE